jgi:uracil-DNA glycosylase family 4
VISLELLEEMKGCTKCSLRAGCNQVVPGSGNRAAKLMIIGEAPGADEDLFGEPFVGQSGKLLNKMLRDASIDRETLYVSNAVKCRPPANRTPSREEIAACKSWLWKELKSLKPQAVLLLGKTATRLLLNLKASFTMKSYVGNQYSVNYIDSQFYVWYHPSYLLNNNMHLVDETVQFLKRIKKNEKLTS